MLLNIMFLSIKSVRCTYIYAIIVLSFINNAIIGTVETNSFTHNTIIDNQNKKPYLNNKYDSQQRSFYGCVRDAEAASLAWLVSIERGADGSDDGKEVFNKAVDLSGKMSALGDLLTESKGQDLLANPENALIYFSLMARINNMLFLLLGVEKKSSSKQFRNAGEHVAKTFSIKNRPAYQQYLATQPADGKIFNEKHFAPFVLAKTLYAPSESSKGISTISRHPEDEQKITNATEGFSDFCREKLDKVTIKEHFQGDVLMWYYSMSHLIGRLFNKRIEHDCNSGILNFVCRAFSTVKSLVWDSNNEKNDPQKNDFNPQIIEINEHIRIFVNEKKYPYSFGTVQNAVLQHYEYPQSVFPYVLSKLPPYKLERHHFNNEPEYQLYLFVSATQHKLEAGCPQIDSYEEHKAFVQQYINHTLTPAIKNLEQNSKEVNFVFNKQHQEYIESARQYCFDIICAKLCESVWRKDTGEDMWPRNGNNSAFAGFSKETIDNLKYMSVLLSSLQNNAGTK